MRTTSQERSGGRGRRDSDISRDLLFEYSSASLSFAERGTATKIRRHTEV